MDKAIVIHTKNGRITAVSTNSAFTQILLEDEEGVTEITPKYNPKTISDAQSREDK